MVYLKQVTAKSQPPKKIYIIIIYLLFFYSYFSLFFLLFSPRLSVSARENLLIFPFK